MRRTFFCLETEKRNARAVQAGGRVLWAQREASNHPTIQPSNHPTIQPSNHPTIQPSNHPTIQPSNHPTIQPSNHPLAAEGGLIKISVPIFHFNHEEILKFVPKSSRTFHNMSLNG